jgi:hypothetical protein
LKQRATREMVPFKNHMVGCLYSLSSKFLALSANHMCKKYTCEKYDLLDFINSF